MRISLLLGIASIFAYISTLPTVYICKGKQSERYHLVKNCRGLSNCSTDTYSVSLSEAKKMGRTLCGWED